MSIENMRTETLLREMETLAVGIVDPIYQLGLKEFIRRFKIAKAAIEQIVDPKPLTIEELRQMIGEPVWTVGVSYDSESWQSWDIIERVDDDGIYFGHSTEGREWWSYNVRHEDGTLYDFSWCAYRHKPKEVQDDA